jgi:hypothetical protein
MKEKPSSYCEQPARPNANQVKFKANNTFKSVANGKKVWMKNLILLKTIVFIPKFKKPGSQFRQFISLFHGKNQLLQLCR